MHISPAGVLRVDVSGPVTAAAVRYLLDQVVANFGQQLRVVLVDYSRAALLLTRQDLHGVISGERADSPLVRPMGAIVKGSDVPMFAEYAAAMALRGVCRQVFTGAQIERATQWATRQAAAMTHCD